MVSTVARSSDATADTAHLTPSAHVPWPRADDRFAGRRKRRGAGNDGLSVAQRDERSPQRHAGDEASRAVDRIDEPAPTRRGPVHAKLLTDHAVRRKARRDPLAGELLGGAVRRGHRRSVLLPLDGDAASKARERDLSRELREFADGLEPIGIRHSCVVSAMVSRTGVRRAHAPLDLRDRRDPAVNDAGDERGVRAGVHEHVARRRPASPRRRTR